MEEIYKVYAESFCGEEHLRRILEEAQSIVSKSLRDPLKARSLAKMNGKEKA